MTGGWLKRHGIALAAVLVLVPVTLGVTFSNEWLNYYAYRPTQPVVVASTAQTEFAETEWAVDGSERIPADSAGGIAAGLPTGSQLVVVTVAVTPQTLTDGKSPLCEVRLDELSGGESARTWGNAIFEPIDYEVPEGYESGCTSERTDPYRFQALFVIPEGVDSPLALHLEVVDELPKYLRFTL